MLTLGAAKPLDASGDLDHILAEIEIQKDSELVFKIRGTPMIMTDKTITCNSKAAHVNREIKKV